MAARPIARTTASAAMGLACATRTGLDIGMDLSATNCVARTIALALVCVTMVRVLVINPTQGKHAKCGYVLVGQTQRMAAVEMVVAIKEYAGAR